MSDLKELKLDLEYLLGIPDGVFGDREVIYGDLAEAALVAITTLEAKLAMQRKETLAHEAFRQEVSDAVEGWHNRWVGAGDSHSYFISLFSRFIIAKPDPLAEAWIEATGNTVGMEPLNEALAKRGGKIVWEGD